MMEETQHMKVQIMGHLQCLYTKLNMDKKWPLVCVKFDWFLIIFPTRVIILHYTQ